MWSPSHEPLARNPSSSEARQNVLFLQVPRKLLKSKRALNSLVITSTTDPRPDSHAWPRELCAPQQPQATLHTKSMVDPCLLLSQYVITYKQKAADSTYRVHAFTTLHRAIPSSLATATIDPANPGTLFQPELCRKDKAYERKYGPANMVLHLTRGL